MDGRHEKLTHVTVRELGKRPGAVIDRARAGERMIITRHGRPVATLQPLDGLVVQMTTTDTDSYGSPYGDPKTQLLQLTESQRRALRESRRGRLFYTNKEDKRVFLERGLIRLIGGHVAVLTGRGIMLREAMQEPNPPLADALYPASLDPAYEEFVTRPIEDFYPPPGVHPDD